MFKERPSTFTKPTAGSYDASPMVTATFFAWIELTRKTSFVVALNQMVVKKVYFSDVLWVQIFGKTMEALWQEFLDSFTINLKLDLTST